MLTLADVLVRGLLLLIAFVISFFVGLVVLNARLSRSVEEEYSNSDTRGAVKSFAVVTGAAKTSTEKETAASDDSFLEQDEVSTG